MGVTKGGQTRKDKPQPAAGLPPGWVTRCRPRFVNTSGNKGQMRKYWYSPILNLQFKSLPSAQRFLHYLKRAKGDEGIAIAALRQDNLDSKAEMGPSGSTVVATNSSQSKKPSPIVNVGDIGYKFRKEFDSGWYSGTVVEIRQHAKGGKDRRCVYEDGDCEDLSLIELQTLAILDPNVTKKKPRSSSNEATKPLESNDARRLPIHRKWKERFLELKEYKKIYGHTCVHDSYDIKLFHWVTSQRAYHARFLDGKRKAYISQEKIDLLKSIGFNFSSKHERGVESEAMTVPKERTSKRPQSHFRKSKRTVRPPQKVDEIYSYDHMKNLYQRNNSHLDDSWTSLRHSKKARVDQSTPERHILSVLEHDIPVDKAAASTLNLESPGNVRPDGNRSDNSCGDDKEWLEKVAASLGADTSTLRQKRLVPSTAPIKSDAASTCSTISCRSDNKAGSDMMKQPPKHVLISQMPSASQESVSNILLSKYSVGSRHGTFVIHKNDKRGRVGEVILEHGDNWVEVAIGGTLKKYHITHLVVVPSKHSKAACPLNFGIACNTSVMSSPRKKSLAKSSPSERKIPSIEKKTLSKKETPLPKKETASPNKKPDKPNGKVSLPSEKNSSAFSVDHLFCWFCDICDASNNVGASECQKCNARKTDKSKRSVLLGIAEHAVLNEAKTVEEAMKCISYSERASIPKRLIAYLLETRSLGASNAGFNFVPRPIVETYFYWICGYCTTQNSYKKTTCSACLQGKSLADRSPLMKIAEDAAMQSQNSDHALLLVPSHERLVIPKAVMNVLVTCVFIIKSRNGNQRRCRKAKKDGFDYCEAHCDPLLLSQSRLDKKHSGSSSQLSTGAEPLSNDNGPTFCGTLSAINEVMPSILSTIQPYQVNKLRWTIKSIEDSVLCGESTAFPLGMTFRKFFTNYGFHDGRIIKVVRKIWADDERGKNRPVLVYRCMYNDNDEEDFLHHEIVSLSQLYDKRNISPEAPPYEQIPPGVMFEMRSGHTIEIIGHKTPPGCNKDEGGIVIVKFCNSSKSIEFDLEELQKAVLRKVGGTSTPTKNASQPSFPDESKETANKLLELGAAPVLEWPMRCQNKVDGESGDVEERFEICKGFSLHQKRYHASSDHHVAQIPTSSNVNNRSDVRPGVSIGMWDPASCYDHLLWDPYASTVCEVCGVNKDDNLVVICDACHRGFHTYCLRPVMVNIPRGDWWCSACSGRSNVQLSYAEFKSNMSSDTHESFRFLGLPFSSPAEFFRIHSDAINLFSLNSQAAIKQHAVSRQVTSKQVVFDVMNVKFIRSPEKNDWRLPTPMLSEEDYRSSILSMVAAMKFCGMESNLMELAYTGDVKEEMNDPSLEVDGITPMSKRNLEIFRAFLHNLKLGVLPPVEIFHDENFGFSVKALGFMRQYTLIGEYLGEVVTMEQSGQSSSDSLMVLLNTGNPKTSLIIDPTRAGNIARFLSGINNRSLVSRRKRNVRTRRFVMDGKMHVCLFTCRPVEAGEILNYDYNAGNEGKDIGQWTKTGFYDTSNFF
ncbi:hypothetical protein ACHAW5_004385 [Stephanodiscus triporus]|uniref:Uncharacterized protein n=1 Tax=Stephanodiscus triporus TaxID=2934178 RepID=A0ABD3QIY9_9STRA